MRLLRLHGGVWLLLDSFRPVASPSQLLVAVGNDTGDMATPVGSHDKKLSFEESWTRLGYVAKRRSCL